MDVRAVVPADPRALGDVEPVAPLVTLLIALVGLGGSVMAFVQGSWIVGALCALPGLVGALFFSLASGSWRSRRTIGNVQVDFPPAPATPYRGSANAHAQSCEVWTLPDAPVDRVDVRFVATEYASAVHASPEGRESYDEEVLTAEIALERASPGVYRGALPLSVLTAAPRTMLSIRWCAIARVVVEGGPIETTVAIRVLPRGARARRPMQCARTTPIRSEWVSGERRAQGAACWPRAASAARVLDDD